MTALKGRAVDAFLDRPDRRIVLVYGPDSGLVSERVAHLLSPYASGSADPFANVVIEGDVVADTPARLAEEAWTVPLFGGTRTIRVTATSRNILNAVAPLLSDTPTDAFIVLEGGDLKPTSPLRKAVERSEVAAALPCYSDDAGSIDRLVGDEARRAGLNVSPDARAMLRDLLGGDRLASRSELAKLLLYCHGRERIEAEDVAAVSGDASAFAIDELVDGAALGDAGTADAVLRKAISAGTAPSAIVSALMRHFMQLADARHGIDRGETAEAAMRGLRPPVFFKRQHAFRRQLGMWPADTIRRCLDVIAAAELETRRRPDLADALVGRCVLAICSAARSRR